ncbi:Mitochondrial carrier domain [Phaffia rhodozyma]|uniref:Mitochondrial carrier domain n=1 Tax=Phaffia rhodozyma TaxID=264483 RepID=A0A0F7SJD2_PHARH|nr:Mitochondrial carrier domain [Phaffia rhodozyma]
MSTADSTTSSQPVKQACLSSVSPQMSSLALGIAPTQSDNSQSVGPTALMNSSATGSPFLASLSRTIIFLIGMMLKRPARIFRPSKVSTFAFIKALAQRDGRSFSPSGLLKLAKRYGPLSLVLPIIPPLFFNTILTTLLFTTHSVISSLLSALPFFRPPERTSGSEPTGFLSETDSEPDTTIPVYLSLLTHNLHATVHPTLLSFLAGAGAGVAQSTLAIPLDKVISFLTRLIVGKRGHDHLKSGLGREAKLPSIPGTPRVNQIGDRAVGGSIKSKRDMGAWLRELRNVGTGPGGALGMVRGFDWGGIKDWKGLGRLGWQGWRWGAAKDAVGYGLFFATFDTSRRLALHVRHLIEATQSDASRSVDVVENTSPKVKAFFGIEDRTRRKSTDKNHSRVDDEDPEEEGGLGYEGSKWARVGQATVLILFPIVSTSNTSLAPPPIQPLRTHRTQRVIKPTWEASLPRAIPLITKTWKKKGPKYFFGPQKGENLGGGGPWKRFGWRLVGVAPWGCGFLVFAWVGGEV